MFREMNETHCNQLGPPNTSIYSILRLYYLLQTVVIINHNKILKRCNPHPAPPTPPTFTYSMALAIK